MAKDTQIGTISDLAKKMLLNRSEQGPSPITFLIGAGCSVSAGIPAAESIAQQLVQQAAIKFKSPKDLDPSDALEFLFAKGLFDGIAKATRNGKKPEWGAVYDALFKEVYSSPDDTRDIFKAIIRDADAKINWAHLALGEMAANDWLSTTITTNFDLLALEGYARAGVVPVVSDGLESLDRIDPSPDHPQLIQINGSIHSYRLRNDETDLADVQASPAAITCFRSLFQASRVFVVVGYAGREPQIMHLLKAAAEAFPDKHVFWCLYSENPDALSDHASEFLSYSKNARLILGKSADNFFLELSKELGLHAPLAFRDPLGYLRGQLESVFDADKVRGLDRVAGEIQALRDKLDQLETCEKSASVDKAGDAADKEAAIVELAEASTASQLEAAEIYKTLMQEAPNERVLFDELRTIQFEWYQRGNDAGDNFALEVSIELARIAQTIAKAADQRGAAANDLANALQTLGDRNADIALLKEAIKANHIALKEYDRDRTPIDWAISQNNLGNSLTRLGELENSNARMEEALSAYRSALLEHAPDEDPMEWASVQNNLGLVLGALGQRNQDITQLGEAVTAFSNALMEHTRDRLPLNWAKTQENLAIAHLTLFKVTKDTAHLETARSAAVSALEVYEEADASFYFEKCANLLKEINDLQ